MNRRVSLLLLACFFLASVSASAPQIAASSHASLKRYRILSTVGRVTAWEPFSTNWVEVTAGMELWESTLVQIHKGGTFSFELASSEALRGIQGEAIQVKLGTPIVVRLNEDITRQLDLGSYFIPNLPNSRSKLDDAAKNPIYQSITEAWQRFAAIAVSQGLPLEGLMPDLASSESALALRAKRMTLLTPANGSTVLVEKVPATVRVMWEEVTDPDVTYEVRLWRLDEPRPGPLALTQIDHHFITVPREGPYFVQVTTADGKYQSEPAQIFVSLPIAGRINKEVSVAGLASLPIPLLLPPDGFIYQTKTFPAPIAFEWDLNIEGETEPVFNFTVTDVNKKPLVQTKVNGRRFVARFARPGKFKWNVTAVIPPVEGEKTEKTITSVNYDFEIRGVAAPERDPIADALFSNKSQVVYLENGFGK